MFYRTNLTVCVTEKELKTFCEKIERDSEMGIWNSFKSKVKAALASLGMLTGVDVTHLMQNFKMDEKLANEIMKSIYVGRGKGGKKQAHRPTGAAAIKRAAKKARNRKRNKKVK
ncbi:TPA: hypothetical protein M5M71_004194 [Escherichia coli]|nr:hypothetical protein [Escherichia coli]HCC4836986.1 hypothetical protein [Escherichia coli]